LDQGRADGGTSRHGSGRNAPGTYLGEMKGLVVCALLMVGERWISVSNPPPASPKLTISLAWPPGRKGQVRRWFSETAVDRLDGKIAKNAPEIGGFTVHVDRERVGTLDPESSDFNGLA